MTTLLRFISCTAIVCLTLISTGCSVDNWEETRKLTYTSNYVPVEFAFPSGWTLNTNEHPYDLQCFSPQRDMQCGIFVFKREDLEEGQTAKKIFDLQIEDIRSKRENFKELDSRSNLTFEGKEITVAPFSADKDGDTNHYTFSLVEFKDNPEVFAILLQVAIPESRSESKSTFLKIARSAKLAKSSEAPIATEPQK